MRTTFVHALRWRAACDGCDVCCAGTGIFYLTRIDLLEMALEKEGFRDTGAFKFGITTDPDSARWFGEQKTKKKNISALDLLLCKDEELLKSGKCVDKHAYLCAAIF